MYLNSPTLNPKDPKYNMNLKKIKIVSGGQTGADRGALDFALEANYACGGWCPKGRKAEDGRIPERYPLQESKSSRYQERTRLNICDSDVTLLFINSHILGKGSKLTAKTAHTLGKPLLEIDCSIPVDEAAVQIRNFVSESWAMVINIAGNRESSSPGIGAYVHSVLSNDMYWKKWT